jgi:hypothetical protein
MKVLRWAGAALAATGALLLSASATAHADGEAVYQSCSTAYAFTTDVNGIEVTCEPMTLDGDWLWLPVLRPSPAPSAYALDPCAVPGLVAAKVGGGTLVCERHFNGFYYWARSV